MDIHTKTDPETKLQLIVIKLDDLEKDIEILNSKIKEIDKSFGGLSISEIAHEIKDVETRPSVEKLKKINPPNPMKKEKKTIYILDYKIKWKPFKELHDRIVKDSGPTPEHVEKILWWLLRERRIYCWFAEDMPSDMGIGLKIPPRYKKWKTEIITNFKKAKKE